MEVADGVFLGRLPRKGAPCTYAAAIDVTAELPGLAVPGLAWHAFASLDLLPVPVARLRAAADALDIARRRGPVLVCCALGFQRSALVAACWLVRSGLAGNAAAAIEQVRAAGRPVHLSFAAYALIEEAAR